MDIISQLVWGALSAQAVSKRKPEQVKPRIRPWLIGLVGGLGADLDGVFRSSIDPLFATVMHRHFTHSIFFIPFGALFVWILFFYFFRKDKQDYFYYYKLAFVGYGTHWILDVMTSYGTLILWPLNTTRYALDWLSIVDPLLTLPWLVVFLLIIITKKEHLRLVHFVLIYSVSYFLFCGWQHHQAVQTISNIAKSRGHQVERVRALPTLANSVWFRGIYQFQGQIYAQGVLINPGKNAMYQEGEVRKVVFLTDIEITSLPVHAQKQIQIWSWFVDGWLYRASNEELSFGDGRYSIDATGFNSLWNFVVSTEDPSLSKKVQGFMNSNDSESSKSPRRLPLKGYQLLLEPKGLLPAPEA